MVHLDSRIRRSTLARWLLAATILLFAPTISNAVEFTVENEAGNSVVLDIGETVEIEIGVSNLSETAVQGMYASVFGYDEAVADFVAGTGRAAASFFSVLCSPYQCFGGIDQSSEFFRLNLSESERGNAGKRVDIVHAAALSATTASGALDQGWDGTQGTPDAVLTFQAIGLGTTVLQIGTGYPGDGIILPDGSLQQASTTFTIHVVPEPGTALLMGLGLAALSTGGHRRAP